MSVLSSSKRAQFSSTSAIAKLDWISHGVTFLISHKLITEESQQRSFSLPLPPIWNSLTAFSLASKWLDSSDICADIPKMASIVNDAILSSICPSKGSWIPKQGYKTNHHWKLLNIVIATSGWCLSLWQPIKSCLISTMWCVLTHWRNKGSVNVQSLL